MIKNLKYHHSISEAGTLQLRIITQYVGDGEVKSEKYSDPVAPPDTLKMDGWDDKSKAIVEAITNKKVLADFKVEKQEPTGVGIEEIVKYDRTLDDLGRISVRRITRIFDEGEEVSKKYHRSWIMPGQDPSGNDVISRAVAEKLHTPKVIATYNTKMAELEAEKIPEELSIK